MFADGIQGMPRSKRGDREVLRKMRKAIVAIAASAVCGMLSAGEKVSVERAQAERLPQLTTRKGVRK